MFARKLIQQRTQFGPFVAPHVPKLEAKPDNCTLLFKVSDWLQTLACILKVIGYHQRYISAALAGGGGEFWLYIQTKGEMKCITKHTF